MAVVDSYAYWFGMYFANSADAEFTVNALQKDFSPESVPRALVAVNGSKFTAEGSTSGLKEIGSYHLLAAPRHLQPNELGE